MKLAGDDVFDGVTDQVVLGGDERVRRPQDLLERVGALDDLPDSGSRGVLAAGEIRVAVLQHRDERLEPIVVHPDGAGTIVVFDGENPEVLVGVLALVRVELLLAEEQDAAAPVEVVLVEGVVAPGMLAGALITVERISLSGLAENVDFELRAALAATPRSFGRNGWPSGRGRQVVLARRLPRSR